MSHALFSHNPEYCVDIIRAYAPEFTPRVAFILGSGLGALAEQIENAVAISYEKLPGFPVSTVHGHAGELVLGHLAGVPVACMKGRGHFYEGRGMKVMTDAIRTLKLLGCEVLFCTNAAGSLRPEVGPGSLVTLCDHINTMPGTPMVGANDERFGDRFFSLANAYDADYWRRCGRNVSGAGSYYRTSLWSQSCCRLCDHQSGGRVRRCKTVPCSDTGCG